MSNSKKKMKETETISEDSDSDSDLESWSDQEEMKIDIDEKGVDQLEVKIRMNPYDLESNIAYVRLLGEGVKSVYTSGKKKEFVRLWNRLRIAWDNFWKNMPLNEHLWLSWICDEVEYDSGVEENGIKIEGLFRKAILECGSVQIWLKYLQYMCSKRELKRDLVLKLTEEALSDVGTDFQECHELWNWYRELLDSENDNQSHLKSVLSVWKRHLSVPHLKLEESHREYLKFCENRSEKLPKGMESEVNACYEDALKKSREVMPYEISLMKIAHTISENGSDKQSPEIMDICSGYLSVVLSKNDPLRTFHLFRRLCRLFPNFVDLWRQFLHFLESAPFITPSRLVTEYRLACRHVYSFGDIWSGYLKALEKEMDIGGPSSLKNVFEVFESGIVAGLESYNDMFVLCQSIIDFSFRKFRNSFEQQQKQQKQQEQQEQEKQHEIDQHQEHKQEQEGVDIVRCTFSRISFLFEAKGKSREIQPLLNFYQLLFQKQQAFFEGRILRNKTAMEDIWESIIQKHSKESTPWLDYFRDEVYIFRDIHKCRQILKRAVNVVSDAPEVIFDCWLQFEREFGSLETYSNASVSIEGKRVELMSRSDIVMVKNDRSISGVKRKKPEGSQSQGQLEPEKQKQKQEHKQKQKLEQSIIEHRHEGGDTLINNKIFIKNFPFTTSKEEIGRFCKTYGKVINVIILKDRNTGKSMGRAFVEYSCSEEAKQALVLNGVVFKDRVVQVEPVSSSLNSSSDNKKKEEENTIFVKNFPLTASKSEIQLFCQFYGQVDYINVLTDRSSGKSLGRAFLRYSSKEEAQEALKGLNGGLFGDRCLVAEAFIKQSKTKTKNSSKIKTRGNSIKDEGIDESRSIFLKNFPLNTTENQIRFVCLAYGNVSKVHILKDRKNGKSLGRAFVSYSTSEEATQALNLNGSTFDNHLLSAEAYSTSIASKVNANTLADTEMTEISTKRSENKGEDEDDRVDDNSNNKNSNDFECRVQEPNIVFVCNLSFSSSEKDLEKLISPLLCSGEENNYKIRLIKDYHGKSKGYAYIQFENKNSVDVVLGLNDTFFMGRKIRAAISNPKKGKEYHTHASTSEKAFPSSRKSMPKARMIIPRTVITQSRSLPSKSDSKPTPMKSNQDIRNMFLGRKSTSQVD